MFVKSKKVFKKIRQWSVECTSGDLVLSGVVLLCYFFVRNILPVIGFCLYNDFQSELSETIYIKRNPDHYSRTAFNVRPGISGHTEPALMYHTECYGPFYSGGAQNDPF